ncbi:MAG TPA: helix-turn-helix domain-containing protein [Gemmatimonadales bacterium]|nr:helix-turn-helix domain-containing protein [Gemmatimonadales bacterium]
MPSARAKRYVPDPWNPECPSRGLIAMLGSKWVLLLMPLLREGPKRNGELMRAIPDISQKMLTQTLRELESRGLVLRRDLQTVPPHVEYELTGLGKSLAKTIAHLDDWVVQNFNRTTASRTAD